MTKKTTKTTTTLSTLVGTFGILLAALVAFALRPPTPFRDRLAVIPEESTIVDNARYDLPMAFRHLNGTGLGSLFLLNQAQLSYFERIWKRELGPNDMETRRFLDVGCGAGITTNALALKGFPIDGIDSSPNALEVAREKADSILPHGHHIPAYVVGSAYDLPVHNDTYDGVLLSHVLEHFHDIRTAMQEVHRVLKPDGIVLLDTISRTTFSWIAFVLVAERLTGLIPMKSHDWRLFVTPEELQRLLESEGFEMGPKTENLGVAPKNILRIHEGFAETGPQDLAAGYVWWARKRAT